MTLKNISLSDVLQLENNKDYFDIAKYLKPKNILNAKPIDEQPFGLVKEFEIATDDKKIIELIGRYCDKLSIEIMEMNFFEFYYQHNFIIEELTKIRKREHEFLNYLPTSKEVSAGIENLYKFGVFATVDALAGGDVLKYKQIEEIPYGIIFTKLYLNKEKNIYENNLFKK